MIARALRNRGRDGKLWYNRHHFYFVASFFFFSSFILSFFLLVVIASRSIYHISNNFVDLL
jgi:hypothetical protein